MLFIVVFLYCKCRQKVWNKKINLQLFLKLMIMGLFYKIEKKLRKPNLIIKKTPHLFFNFYIGMVRDVIYLSKIGQLPTYGMLMLHILNPRSSLDILSNSSHLAMNVSIFDSISFNIFIFCSRSSL